MQSENIRIQLQDDVEDELRQDGAVDAASPKFQRGKSRISTVINDLRQMPFPVSGYILINRSASDCNASASVTWSNRVWFASAVITHVFRQRVPR